MFPIFIYRKRLYNLIGFPGVSKSGHKQLLIREGGNAETKEKQINKKNNDNNLAIDILSSSSKDMHDNLIHILEFCKN